jgi:hypothetical protein
LGTEFDFETNTQEEATMMRPLAIAASLAALTLSAAEAPAPSDSAALLFGTTRDSYDPGFGAAWVKNLAPDMAFFIGIERVSFEDESSYRDPWSSSQTSVEADGYEVQLGYLHRIGKPEGGLSLQLGPAIGLEQLNGEQRTRYTSAYSYGDSSDRTDIDYDLGVNVYLQAFLRYTGFKSVDLFASVSYGYRSGREARYTSGGGYPPPVVPVADTADTTPVPTGGGSSDYTVVDGSDTFLRFALGVAIPL